MSEEETEDIFFVPRAKKVEDGFGIWAENVEDGYHLRRSPFYLRRISPYLRSDLRSILSGANIEDGFVL